ncbi:MAG: peptidase S8/S53 subtilisin kexin sedolisin, partial [uncultured bacterium]
MNLRAFVGIVLWGFVLSFSMVAKAETCPQSYCFEYLAKFSRQAGEVDIDAILKKESLSVISYFESSRIYHLADDRNRSQDEILQALRAEPLVMYAEPNYTITASSVPNDPFYPNQWAFNNVGQYQGVTGIDLGMESVWDILTNPEPIVVAVLDSGVDYRHEDLADNMWKNQDEVPNNGQDDDGNGYIDDVYGYNFYSDTSDPFDDYFHGTHVAGIIGAVSNNGIGVTGINWNVKLMALKFMTTDGRGPLSGAIEAIDYAVKNGAKIINNSWDFAYPGLVGLPASPALEPVQSLRDAISVADRAGVIFVAAAGNSGQNNDVTPSYPSSYSVGNIISVTAIDNKNVMTPFSNYGSVSVDIGAPGVLIQSTYPTWKENPPYHYLSGTSMACPEVTGAAALLWADHPELTHRQVIDYILQGVEPVSNMSGKSVTGGRVDLAGTFALSSSSVNHPPVATAGAIQSKTIGDTVLLVGTATDADGDTPLTYQWTLVSPVGEINNFNSSQVSFTADLVGTYLASLVVSDGKSTSLPSTTKIYVANVAPLNHTPVASAGPNQLRYVGDKVLLQGKGTDQDGDALTYKWTLALPLGSKTSLSSATSATASFYPDVTGTYTATLVVNDGQISSSPAIAKIYVLAATSSNHPPTASAGPS